MLSLGNAYKNFMIIGIKSYKCKESVGSPDVIEQRQNAMK